MSESDTSIEARSIISSLAATSSFSAVVFLPLASLVGTLVFNCGPITLPENPAAHKRMPRLHSRVN